MEDRKLKECWVVLTDCMVGGHATVPYLERRTESAARAETVGGGVKSRGNGPESPLGKGRKTTMSVTMPFNKTYLQDDQTNFTKPKLIKQKMPHNLCESPHKIRTVFTTNPVKQNVQLVDGKFVQQKLSCSTEVINKAPQCSLIKWDQSVKKLPGPVNQVVTVDKQDHEEVSRHSGDSFSCKSSLRTDVFTKDAKSEINKMESINNQNIDARILQSAAESSVNQTNCVRHEDLVTTNKHTSGTGVLFTNPSCPMPAVGLILDVKAGHPLPSWQAKCVLNCLKGCKNSLTAEYAEFSMAVVQPSSQVSTRKVMLHVEDEEVLRYMQIRWNAKSAVKKEAVTNCLRASKLQPRVHMTKPLSVNTAEATVNILKSMTKHEAGDSYRDKSSIILGKKQDRNVRTPNQENLKINCVGQNSKLHPICVKKLFQKKEIVAESKNACYTDLLSPEVLANSDSGNAACKGDSILRKHSKLSLLADDKEKLTIPEIVTIKDDDETGIRFAKNSSMSGSILKNIDVKAGIRTMDIDDALRNVSNKTICHIPQALYDPDDTRGIKDVEVVAEKPRGTRRGRSSHQIHELRRLNVAIFDMPSCEPIVCNSPDICRLGCVCSSLSARIVRDNCGLEKCIFGCVCLKTRRESQSFTWMQNKAKANLAKEERYFKQTVVRSGKNDLILVEGKQKRKIKVPKKYSEDFVSETDFQLFHKINSSRHPKTLIHDTEMSNKTQRSSRKRKSLLESQSSIMKGNSERNMPLVSKQLNSITSNNLNSVPSKAMTVVKTSEESAQQNSAEIIFSKPASSLNSNFSARTTLYGYSSKEVRQAKQMQLLNDSSRLRIEPLSELKIVSVQSLGPEDWEETENKTYPDAATDPCSYLFNPEFIREKGSDVVLLPWAALWKGISINRNIFLWFNSIKVKPKIYLTNSYVKPSVNCVELQSIDFSSDKYKNVPFHLKKLTADYLPAEGEEKCVWIAKYVKSMWMIVGFMQPEKQNPQPICDSDVDILPSQDEDSPNRWWVMDLRQNFDLIYFMDSKKALTKGQINTLVNLSKDSQDKSKVHRILLNRRRPKIDPTPVPYPDFGAYSSSDRPYDVLIGPYHSFKEPRFQVFSQKVALNGKSEYESIPLFYCGGGECVRVNSQGVLSLHSETLPKKYVQGSWYQSCGVDPRESNKKLDAARQLAEQDDIGHLAQSNRSNVTAPDSTLVSPKESYKIIHFQSPEVNDIHDSENELEFAQIESLPTEDISDVVSVQRKDMNEKGKKMFVSPKKSQCKSEKQIFEVSQSQGDNSLDHTVGHPKSLQCESVEPPISQLKKYPIAPVISPSEKDNNSELQPNGTVGISNSGSITRDLENEAVTDSEESIDLGMEYLIPSIRRIGVLSLTYLPGGTISTINFTEPGLLKFFHNKEEIIKEINMLIHQKLVCFSMKCSDFLQSNGHCKCVSWKTSSNKQKCMRFPQFSPEIFNGFFMLTKYGLLDLRSTGKLTIKKLGPDWVEWLKNDEIRLGLCKWNSEQKQDVIEKLEELMKVLPSARSSNLSLLQVLAMATNEIVKLKAVTQLLNQEYQTQQLMKETLILSLCQKLDRIPRNVVPKFLDQLELHLLWDVLECMHSRNTLLLPEERPSCSLPVSPTSSTEDREQSPPRKRRTRSVKQSPKSPRLASVAKETASTAVDDRTSGRMRAILYRRRLMEECKRDRLLQLKRLKQQKVGSGSTKKTNPYFASNGLVCQVSPFSRLNICVEEGGIKYTPLSSPPPLFPPVPDSVSQIPVSPGKPPNILRKSKYHPPDIPLPGSIASPSVNSALKQSRKQIFFCDKNEEPVFMDFDSTLDNPDHLLDSGMQYDEKDESNSFSPSKPDAVSSARENESGPSFPTTSPNVDPISSLVIASVVSVAENVASPLQAETDVLPTAPSMVSATGPVCPPLSSVPPCAVASVSNSLAGENLTDPIASPGIAPVVSTPNVSSEFCASPSIDSDPSLCKSLVTSEAEPSASVLHPASTSVSSKTSAQSNTVSPDLSQSCASSSELSVSPTKNSSGLAFKVFLKSTTVETLMKTGPGSDLSKGVKSPAKCVGQASGVPGHNTAIRGYKPFYILSTKDGKLVKTETPISLMSGAVGSKSTTMKNFKRSLLKVELPVSSLKIQKPAICNKSSDANLGDPKMTSVHIASSTHSENPDPRISASNLELASTLTQQSEL